MSEQLGRWVYGLLVDHGEEYSLIQAESGIKHMCLTSSIGQYIGGRALGDEGEGWHWTVLYKDGSTKIFPPDKDTSDYGKGWASAHPTNNGPELYENDIVTSTYRNGKKKSDGSYYKERVHSLIVFDGGSLEWKLQRLEEGRGYRSYSSWFLGEDILLVGNSTEHPHLLSDDIHEKFNQLGHLVWVR